MKGHFNSWAITFNPSKTKKEREEKSQEEAMNPQDKPDASRSMWTRHLSKCLRWPDVCVLHSTHKRKGGMNPTQASSGGPAREHLSPWQWSHLQPSVAAHALQKIGVQLPQQLAPQTPTPGRVVQRQGCLAWVLFNLRESFLALLILQQTGMDGPLPGELAIGAGQMGTFLPAGSLTQGPRGSLRSCTECPQVPEQSLEGRKALNVPTSQFKV